MRGNAKMTAMGDGSSQAATLQHTLHPSLKDPVQQVVPRDSNTLRQTRKSMLEGHCMFKGQKLKPLGVQNGDAGEQDGKDVFELVSHVDILMEDEDEDEHEDEDEDKVFMPQQRSKSTGAAEQVDIPYRDPMHSYENLDVFGSVSSMNKDAFGSSPSIGRIATNVKLPSDRLKKLRTPSNLSVVNSMRIDSNQREDMLEFHGSGLGGVDYSFGCGRGSCLDNTFERSQSWHHSEPFQSRNTQLFPDLFATKSCETISTKVNE